MARALLDTSLIPTRLRDDPPVNDNLPPIDPPEDDDGGGGSGGWFGDERLGWAQLFLIGWFAICIVGVVFDDHGALTATSLAWFLLAGGTVCAAWVCWDTWREHYRLSALLLMLLAGCSTVEVASNLYGYAGECFDERQTALFAALKVPEIAVSGSAATETAVSEVSYVEPSKELQVINSYRAARGLSQLTENPKLIRAAQDFAVESASRGYVGHFSADGSDSVDRVVRTGYRASEIGENAHGGTYSDTFEDAFKAWIDSPPHKEVLEMTPASHFGWGMRYDPNSQYQHYWVMLVTEPERRY